MTHRLPPFLYDTITTLLLLILSVVSALVDHQIMGNYFHFYSPLVGCMAAALLLRGLQRWPLLIPSVLAYPLIFGFAWPLLLSQALLQFLLAILVAWLLRGLVLQRVRDNMRLLLVALLLATLSASGGLFLFAWLAPGMLVINWQHWCFWWASEGTGIVLTLPLLLCLWRGPDRQAIRARPLEFVLLMLASAVVTFFVFYERNPYASRPSFMLFPVVVMAALRFGYVGAMLVMLVAVNVASGAIQSSSISSILIEQCYLLTMTVTGLLLAASHGEQRQQAVELAREQYKLRNILDAQPNYIHLQDMQGNLLFANKAFAQLVERPAAALIGQPVSEVFAVLGGLPDFEAKQSRVFQWTYGSVQQRTLLCSQFPLLDEQQHNFGVGFTATDLTEQLAAEEQLRLASQVFENASEGILMTDADARIIAVNPAFTRITGYAPSEAIGRVSRMFWSGERGNEVTREIGKGLETEGHWQGEMLDRRKDGEFYPAWLSISAMRNPSGAITHYVGVFSDFTSRKETESRLQFLAERDPLTQLYNRTALQERLATSILAAKELNTRLVLLFIDLDRFKFINDSLGHAVGDELLQVIALRLRHCLKQEDVIARLGGDEFTVLLDNPPDDARVAEIVGRVVVELARPALVRGHEVMVTSSIGVARYPTDAQDAQTLMQAADLAMYYAKEKGKNNFQFYAASTTGRVYEVGLLEGKLKTALQRNQFVLYYQPQYELAGEQLVGVEALIRWLHPDMGMTSPNQFIPLAEETGQIVSIGEWVMMSALRQLCIWRQAGLHVPRVAVNLSARQLDRERLLAFVRRALDETGVEPSGLELEITESMIMEDHDEAVSTLAALRAMGVRVAIDDFGTGYSSLANLKDYPADCLKIDRSFIIDAPDDTEAAAITEAIVALSKRLGLLVLAEGVENEKQATWLRHIGCEVVQGFFFARPQPPELLRDVWRSDGTLDSYAG